MSPTLTPLEQLSFFTMQGFGYKGKKLKRPGTSDSARSLISKREPSSSIEVYNSYRESLNSLIEIVDKVSLRARYEDGNLVAHGTSPLQDDKTSLKLIHDILHAGDDEDDDNDDDRAASKADDDDYDFSESDVPSTSARSGRRRSLSLCSSVTSLRSEYSITSITSPLQEISTFEQKRRRAAKLTNFFGVSHRDIITDILESIESGVAEERGRGILNQAQVDVRLPCSLPLFPLWWNVDGSFWICRPVFRIYSRKYGTSKPGLDDFIYFCIYHLAF